MPKNPNEYEDSGEFQGDMDALLQLLADAQMIVNKPEFEEWMRATDKHFNLRNGKSTLDVLLRLKVEVDTAERSTKEMWDLLLEAN